MSITVGADNAANKIVFYYTVNSYPLNITYKYADDVPDAALRGQKAAELYPGISRSARLTALPAR